MNGAMTFEDANRIHNLIVHFNYLTRGIESLKERGVYNGRFDDKLAAVESKIVDEMSKWTRKTQPKEGNV